MDSSHRGAMALLQAAQSLENYGRKSQGFPSARPSRGHKASASPSPPKLSAGVSPREDPGFYATNGAGKSDTTGSESSSGSTGKPNGRKRKYTEKHHYADRKAYAAPRRMQRLPTENGIMTNGHVRNAKHYTYSNGNSTSTLSNGTWGRLNGIDSGTKTKAKKKITKNKSKKHASRYNNREIIKQEKIGNGSGSMKNIHSNLKHTLLSDDETSSSGSHKSVGRTEAKLEANLQALSKKGISLEEVAKVPCLHQNIFEVSIVEELTKRHICHVCMSEVKIEKVLKSSNSYPCPGRMGGFKCNQVHSFSFCRGILYSRDIGPLRHCKTCKKCVPINSKHCRKCNRCYIVAIEGTQTATSCQCDNQYGDTEIFDQGCQLS